MTTPELKALAPQTTQRFFGADAAEPDELSDLFLLTRRPRDVRVGRDCAAEGVVETYGCDRSFILLVPLGEGTTWGHPPRACEKPFEIDPVRVAVARTPVQTGPAFQK